MGILRIVPGAVFTRKVQKTAMGHSCLQIGIDWRLPDRIRLFMTGGDLMQDLLSLWEATLKIPHNSFDHLVVPHSGDALISFRATVRGPEWPDQIVDAWLHFQMNGQDLHYAETAVPLAEAAPAWQPVSGGLPGVAPLMEKAISLYGGPRAPSP